MAAEVVDTYPHTPATRSVFSARPDKKGKTKGIKIPKFKNIKQSKLISHQKRF